MISFEKIKDYNKENIFFSSDFHAFHQNICSGISTWSNKQTRDFKNEIDMTTTIANNINSKVKENDLLIHLGDWSFGGYDNAIKFRNMIDCKNIINIYGNHDHLILKHKELQDLFMTCEHVMYIKINNKNIFLSHYPHYVFHQYHHGAMHLFGHVHGNLSPKGKMIDVGIDNYFKLFGKYEPFSFMEIENILDKVPINFLDHHDINTN